MLKINTDVVNRKIWWMKFWQYVMIFLLLISVAPVAAYLCWMFKMPVQYYVYAGVFFLVQVILMYFSPRLIWELIKSLIGKSFTEIRPESHPKLYQQLELIAQRVGIPMPRAFIIDSVTPNAFAMKVKSGNYIACMTQKLADMMDEDEEYGVMAHEFTHIRNDDITLTMCAVAFNLIFKIASSYIMNIIVQRGLERSQALGLERVGTMQLAKQAGAKSFFMTISFAYRVLTYFPYLISIMVSHISQRKEYAADAGAALAMGTSQGLIKGLIKLEKYKQRMPIFPAAFNPLFAVPVNVHWFLWPLLIFKTFRDTNDALTPPTWMRRLRNLFESHPTTYDRIKALQSYEQ